MFEPYEDDSLSVNLPRLRVSLRIWGASLDPDFLTQQLGVAPTFSAHRGEEVQRGARTIVQEVGVWSYRADVPPDTELGEAIGMLLDVFPEDTNLWTELTSTYTTDVFCGVFLQADNQSTRVDEEVLTALGRRGLSVSFDFYAPFGRDGDDAS